MSRVLIGVLSLTAALGFVSASAGDEVYVSQVGTDNVYTYQSEGTDNRVEARQTGSGHNERAPATLPGNRVIGGPGPLPSGTQKGTGNRITLTQTGSGNFAVQYQQGEHNSASVTQIGANNVALQAQTGADNHSVLFQQGRNLSAGLYQDQAYGGKISVVQRSAGATLSVVQTGNNPPPVNIVQ